MKYSHQNSLTNLYSLTFIYSNDGNQLPQYEQSLSLECTLASFSAKSLDQETY